MSSTKHNQGLFMQSNGLPMVFHLPPGPTKKKLVPIIKRHGGEITSRNLKNIIRLADEKLWTSRLLSSSSNCYWPTFIVDCVKHNTLLDLELYMCSKGRRLMRKISVEDGNDGKDDEFDFGIDDDMGPASVVKKKGRMHYTKAEDMNILKYLMENGEYRRAKGLAVWNTMEKLKITSHSAQSMMTRFRKVILNQLDEYNIPDFWKTRLTGDLARFAPSSKSTTTKGDRERRVLERDDDDDADKADLPQPSSSRPDQQVAEAMEEDLQTSTDSVLEADNEETRDSFDQQLLQMAHADEQEVGGHRKSTRVGADDLAVSAHEPGGGAGEPRDDSAELEQSAAKRRRPGRAESGCEEDQEVALPTMSSPERRRRKKLHPRRRMASRSPHGGSQRASTPVASRSSEEEEEASESVSAKDRRLGSRVRQQTSRECVATPSTSNALLCPVTPPIYGNSSLPTSPLFESGTLVCACKERERQGKHREKKGKRMTALGAVRALSQEFGLTLKEAQWLLRRNSGHVDAMRTWIMTGRTLPGHQYWTVEEDHVLLTCQPDHPDWQRLEERYGLSPVLHRIRWLRAAV